MQIGTCTGAKNGGRRECDGPSQQTCNTEPCECNEHIVQEFSEIFGLNDTWCGVPPNFDSLVGPLKIRVGAVCGQLNFNSTKLDKQYAHKVEKLISSVSAEVFPGIDSGRLLLLQQLMRDGMELVTLDGFHEVHQRVVR